MVGDGEVEGVSLVAEKENGSMDSRPLFEHKYNYLEDRTIGYAHA